MMGCGWFWQLSIELCCPMEKHEILTAKRRGWTVEPWISPSTGDFSMISRVLKGTSKIHGLLWVPLGTRWMDACSWLKLVQDAVMAGCAGDNPRVPKESLPQGVSHRRQTGSRCFRPVQASDWALRVVSNSVQTGWTGWGWSKTGSEWGQAGFKLVQAPSDWFRQKNWFRLSSNWFKLDQIPVDGGLRKAQWVCHRMSQNWADFTNGDGFV
jgi:hypothetical protein